MTALAEDLSMQYTEGVELDFPVAASQKLYGGGFGVVNAGGYALPGSDTAGLIFQGVAIEQVDNSVAVASIVRRVRHHHDRRAVLV